MEKFLIILRKTFLVLLMISVGFGALTAIGYVINYTNQLNEDIQNRKVKAFKDGKTLMCLKDDSKKYRAFNKDSISLIDHSLYLDNQEPIKLDRCKVVN